MKRTIYLILMVALAIGFCGDLQAKSVQKKRAPKTAYSKKAPAKHIDKPFKGKFEYSSGTYVSIDADIDLYSKSVIDKYSGEYCYGLIEGVFNKGNRLDDHTIERVISINGNSAKVSGTCGYGGEPFTATLTYDQATGKLTIVTSSDGMCMLLDKFVLKRIR